MYFFDFEKKSISLYLTNKELLIRSDFLGYRRIVKVGVEGEL